MNIVPNADGSWKQVVLSGTRAILQSGTAVELWMGTAAPGANGTGIVLNNNIPVYADLSTFTYIAVRGRANAVVRAVHA